MNHYSKITKDLLDDIAFYISINKSEMVFIPIDSIPLSILDNDSKSVEMDFDDIEHYIKSNKSEEFSKTLFEFIDKSGMSDSDVYKKAGINRRVFSDIRCKHDRIPTKKNILAFCLALELNLNDAKKLLRSAGYSLTNNNLLDLIVSYCLDHKIYSLIDVNIILSHFQVETFNI